MITPGNKREIGIFADEEKNQNIDIMKVVVAIDSMKGCLGSKEASEACAEGVRKILMERDIKSGNLNETSENDVIAIPVADGGEGTAEAIAYANKQISRMQSRVMGPDGNPVDAEWWLDKSKGIAYMDMAAAAGLTLLPLEKRNPMKTSTYGVGQMILAASEAGARKIILGLGGSATVDGGMGACQALGVKFLKSEELLEQDKISGNKEMPSPILGQQLADIIDIDITGIDDRIKGVNILLACDVTAPFTGKDGAARVFGPQKGANPDEVEILEKGLENLRGVILQKLGIDLNSVPGSGAAGGCAGGLVSLLGAKIEKGASLVLDSIGFDDIIKDSDLVITGEGSADRQTLMGKLPFEILHRGKKNGIPVILVAGKIRDEDALKTAGFAKIIDINSVDNIRRSNTEDGNAMDSDIAKARLKSCCDLKLKG